MDKATSPSGGRSTTTTTTTNNNNSNNNRELRQQSRRSHKIIAFGRWQLQSVEHRQHKRCPHGQLQALDTMAEEAEAEEEEGDEQQQQQQQWQSDSIVDKNVVVLLIDWRRVYLLVSGMSWVAITLTNLYSKHIEEQQQRQQQRQQQWQQQKTLLWRYS
ncbi:hypothetical protein AWZ03_005410 [Drosophila navojoa]|uniref:Uncharacterized protein n=1 Tax=Drosophila navojoa TaxID=7232 RepID=A0A484BK94_DRONA|nr:hypothetical protein AWZ03_005410 [Drosophila navojoa]